MILPGRPSDVLLTGVSAMPLVGTLGRAELEFTAALIVRALQRKGDTWDDSVDMDDIKTAIALDKKEKHELAEVWSMPFHGLDARGLVAAGFAKWDQPGKRGDRIYLTTKFFEALSTARICHLKLETGKPT